MCYSQFLTHHSCPAEPMRKCALLRSSISPSTTGEGEGNCPEGCWMFSLLWMYMLIICVVCVVCVICGFGCIGLTWCWCYAYVNATYCGVFGTYVGRAPLLQWLCPTRSDLPNLAQRAVLFKGWPISSHGASEKECLPAAGRVNSA